MSARAVTMRLLSVVTQEGDWYVARCLEIELASQGRTQQEAIDNLREALELRFDGEPPALPAHPAFVTTVDFKTGLAGAA